MKLVQIDCSDMTLMAGRAGLDWEEHTPTAASPDVMWSSCVKLYIKPLDAADANWPPMALPKLAFWLLVPIYKSVTNADACTQLL